MAKKPNPQDTTRRNNTARKKEITALDVRLDQIEARLKTLELAQQADDKRSNRLTGDE